VGAREINRHKRQNLRPTESDVSYGWSISEVPASRRDVFFPSMNGHVETDYSSPSRARCRLMHCSKEGVLFDHLVGVSVCAGSFGQTRFPKTLNQQLRV
jgi:hypothetical protein